MKPSASKISLPLTLALCLSFTGRAEMLNTHPVHLDQNGKLLSWVEPQGNAYGEVTQLAWNFLLHSVPIEGNGQKAYLTYCCMDSVGLHIQDWPHDPAMMYGAFAESASRYYAYSGNRAVVNLVEQMLDYDLAHGQTAPDWDWASVAYASADAGATTYQGADDVRYNKYCDQITIPNYRVQKSDWKGRGCGTGDGRFVIEPDKVGELGFGLLEFYELTGKAAYREAAIRFANVLANHIRKGDALHSPWPFRVFAKTNVAREEYSSNVIGPVRLFDELIRLKLGNVNAYRRARDMAWNWMMQFPLKNDHWSGYFEDIQIFAPGVDFNQYSPLETARYILLHQQDDPNWRADVRHLIDLVAHNLVVDAPKEPAIQWGAETVSEQFEDMNKMGSHTSRYGSVNALWFEITGDLKAKETAFRSLNWATYMCRANGVVNVGPVDQSIWWADGYADYIRHFMAAMASVPAWAPAAENHLLRSSSVVSDVVYSRNKIVYKTFDSGSEEELRLAFKPKRVLEGGRELPRSTQGEGWDFDTQTGVLIVRHTGKPEIVIE